MNGSPGALEMLSSRVDELERRVHALEHPEESRTSSTVQATVPPILDSKDSTSALETGNFFPIVGRAMLGVAGAYVLRAIAEAQVAPRLTVSVLAVIYAFGWLVWSPRGRGNVARIVYAGTSALILAPLLWENTLRFHAFTPIQSAGALAAFVTLATLLELRSSSPGSMWIAQILAALTTIALGFATRDVLPFLITLLIAVSISEFARSREYAQPLWPLIVLIADTAIWGLIFIYSGSQNARVAYPGLGHVALIAPACMLFAMNGTAVAVRVLVHEERISVFEIIQVVIAFLLAVSGVLAFAPHPGVAALGIFSLILAACGYTATNRYLRHRNDPRNVRVFGVWSAALLLAGSLWALPHAGAAIVLAVGAVTATYLARRMEPGMLEFHAALFLLAGIITAGLPQYIFYAIAASVPQSLMPSTVVVSVCAALTFVVANPEIRGASRRMFRFFSTLVCACALIALMVHGGLSLAAEFLVPEAHHVAFLRTLIICVAALIMAFVGSRWTRVELTHTAYIALAFVAAKLLFEDLRHGHMEFIAGSIALFAIALIAAPRLVRLGARLRAGVREETPVHIHN